MSFYILLLYCMLCLKCLSFVYIIRIVILSFHILVHILTHKHKTCYYNIIIYSFVLQPYMVFKYEYWISSLKYLIILFISANRIIIKCFYPTIKYCLLRLVIKRLTQLWQRPLDDQVSNCNRQTTLCYCILASADFAMLRSLRNCHFVLFLCRKKPSCILIALFDNLSVYFTKRNGWLDYYNNDKCIGDSFAYQLNSQCSVT